MPALTCNWVSSVVLHTHTHTQNKTKQNKAKKKNKQKNKNRNSYQEESFVWHQNSAIPWRTYAWTCIIMICTSKLLHINFRHRYVNLITTWYITWINRYRYMISTLIVFLVHIDLLLLMLIQWSLTNLKSYKSNLNIVLKKEIFLNLTYTFRAPAFTPEF